MYIPKLPPPHAFGLPGYLGSWRGGQEDAILHMQDSTKRIIAQVQPTGSGKSVCYMVGAILNGGRVLILTSTKGLQKQLSAEFGTEPGISVVVGKNAYRCPVSSYTCDLGPCNFTGRCAIRNKCPYHIAIEKAKNSQLVLANYAFWLTNEEDILGDFDLLICDEAHDIISQLCNTMAVSITSNQIDKCHLYEITYPENEEDLWNWVSNTNRFIKERIKEQVNIWGFQQLIQQRDFKAQFRLKLELEKLENINQEQWVSEHHRNLFTFDPLWPAEFVKGNLFRSIDKIFLTSAMITKKVIELLGISKNELDFREFPSRFPVLRRPIYWIPTCRVDFRMSGMDKNLWNSRIDQIIKRRLDRKGIIHTVSYKRCQEILDSSEYSPFIISHLSGKRDGAIDHFKRKNPPAILVSPSVATGYDFPYEQCEYQIISKIPFPDQRKRVDKKRKEIDPEFGINSAMQELVQAVGRGMRSKDDRCETFIIDDHAAWFINKNKHLAPQSFIEAFTKAKGIPAPLEKL